MNALNVDESGLDEMDNKILSTIIDKFKGGPVGLTTLATAVSESGETIEEVYEPFLIQEGFIILKAFAWMKFCKKKQDNFTIGGFAR